MRIRRFAATTTAASVVVLAGLATSPSAIAAEPAATTSTTSASSAVKVPGPKRLSDVLAGKTVLRAGDRGMPVAVVQMRLQHAGLYFGRAHGVYDNATVNAVTRLQEKFLYNESGRVNKYTYQLLLGITYRGSVLPAPCRTGLVICVDKTQRMLRLVRDGRVVMAMDARFGAPGKETREGLFHVFAKVADDYSRLYNVPMLYSMYFSGGQAIHYSFGFAADGYYGASAGCVNTRIRSQAAALFANTPTWTPVLIYT